MAAIVLMYHRLAAHLEPQSNPGTEVYTVAPERFQEQMAFLVRAAPCLPFETLAAEWREGRETLTSGVALTFDDGYESDHLQALPALLRNRLTAAFFITPAWIGTPGHLDWDQVRDLHRHGMVVGAHGLDHTLLSTLSTSRVRAQLREARRLMQERLGQPPSFLSLPGGAGGPEVADIARDEGYTLVANSAPMRCTRGGRNALLPRFAVRRQDDSNAFQALVQQRSGALARLRFRYYVLTSLRRVVGGSFYRRIRESWARRAARS